MGDLELNFKCLVVVSTGVAIGFIANTLWITLVSICF